MITPIGFLRPQVFRFFAREPHAFLPACRAPAVRSNRHAIVLVLASILALTGLPAWARRALDEIQPAEIDWTLIERHGAMVWAVHQLDADTTGLNLFVTEKRLVDLFKQRMTWPRCEKTYLAVLQGIPDRDQIHQEAPIGVHPDDARGLGVNPDGRSASTHFEIVSRGKDVSLARVRIETGRTHQIRIHAADMGHPLVGEEWYCDPPCSLHPRQALHANRLSFRDGDEPREFEAPIPEDLGGLCERLGLNLASLSDRAV